ncbi:MAG: molybdenum cofactor guanylyltransferase [Myxococcaceae bacterium]
MPEARDTAQLDVTLAILAGGRARRLGGIPKGLLRRDGQPLLARLLQLAPRFAEVLLVTSEPAVYAGFNVRAVPDVLANRGAPGGVHAALVHAHTPWVLVVAADMPFVTLAAMELLLGERSEAVDAVGFEVDGRLEPLLACYRASLAPSWGAALADNPSFRDLWHRVRTALLPKEALRQVDPTGRAVVSVNTPEDAEAFAIELPGRPR